MKKQGFLSYFTTQLKRYLKGLPLILSMTVLILLAIGLIGYSYMKERTESAEQNLATIGVVGDLEGSYLGIGITAIESLDASQYTIRFENMDEDEAKKALSMGDIAVYIIVPNNFVDEVANGGSPKLKMVGRGTQGIGGIIITELAEVISVYLNSSETAMYAMQSYAWSKGDTYALTRTSDAFFMLEANNLFARDSALKPTLIGVGNGSTMVGYYTCSIVLLFILLMGICFCAIFIRQKKDIQKVLYSKGVGPVKQVLAEYLCYLLMVLAITTLLVVIGSILATVFDVKLALWNKTPMEIRWMSVAQIIWMIYLKWLPAVALIASLQYMIFEMTNGIVSSVLAQFLTAVALGYISGLFYPVSFFPVVLRKIAAVLPVKIAMDYCQGVINWNIDIRFPIIIGVYIVLFIFVAIVIRKNKLKR